MKSSQIIGNDFRAPSLKSLILMGMVVLVLFLPGFASHAEDGDLAKEDKACLKCHDKVGLVKKLENGEKLSLHVSATAYVESMHNKTSCEDCHDNIDSKSHAKQKSIINSQRELSLSLRDSCRTCHKKKFTEYEDSVHACHCRM